MRCTGGTLVPTTSTNCTPAKLHLLPTWEVLPTCCTILRLETTGESFLYFLMSSRREGCRPLKKDVSSTHKPGAVEGLPLSTLGFVCNVELSCSSSLMLEGLLMQCPSARKARGRQGPRGSGQLSPHSASQPLGLEPYGLLEYRDQPAPASGHLQVPSPGSRIPRMLSLHLDRWRDLLRAAEPDFNPGSAPPVFGILSSSNSAPLRRTSYSHTGHLLHWSHRSQSTSLAFAWTAHMDCWLSGWYVWEAHWGALPAISWPVTVLQHPCS